MTGIDTNILVRYFMQDDPTQNHAAAQFLDSLSSSHPGYLSLLTIAELWWVLSRSYKINARELCALMHHLLDSEDLLVENNGLVQKALKRAESNSADLADCLIAYSAEEAGCIRTVTFDQKAARSAGMMLLT